MTWFKVDDGMWRHPKVLRCSSLALGVWVRVGAYCADQLTDGLVSMETVYTVCPESKTTVDRAVAELVRRRLWEVVDDPDGRQFHDWADHQPTKAEVLARREMEREKKRKQRRDKAGQFTVLQGGASP